MSKKDNISNPNVYPERLKLTNRKQTYNSILLKGVSYCYCYCSITNGVFRLRVELYAKQAKYSIHFEGGYLWQSKIVVNLITSGVFLIYHYFEQLDIDKVKNENYLRNLFASTDEITSPPRNRCSLHRRVIVFMVSVWCINKCTVF